MRRTGWSRSTRATQPTRRRVHLQRRRSDGQGSRRGPSDDLRRQLFRSLHRQLPGAEPHTYPDCHGDEDRHCNHDPHAQLNIDGGRNGYPDCDCHNHAHTHAYRTGGANSTRTPTPTATATVTRTPTRTATGGATTTRSHGDRHPHRDPHFNRHLHPHYTHADCYRYRRRDATSTATPSVSDEINRTNSSNLGSNWTSGQETYRSTPTPYAMWALPTATTSLPGTADRTATSLFLPKSSSALERLADRGRQAGQLLGRDPAGATRRSCSAMAGKLWRLSDWAQSNFAIAGTSTISGLQSGRRVTLGLRLNGSSSAWRWTG